MIAGRDTKLALAYLERRHYKTLQVAVALDSFFIFPSTEDSKGGMCPLGSDENFALVQSDIEPF